MRPPHLSPDASYTTLVGFLQTLAKGSEGLPADAPSLRRLHGLVAGLRPTPHQSPPPLPEVSLDRAVALVVAAHGLLPVLHDTGGASPLGAETAQNLSETLRDLAVSLGAALRRQQAHRVRGLYVIIDPQVTGGRDPLDIAAAAIRGGARMLQLRDKLRDKGQILPLAMALQRLCQANDVLLIINDHVDLAAVVGAGGAHVGQTDLPVAQARRVLAPHQVLGRSNREIDQIIQSQEMGADHVAFGAIYLTSTKTVVRSPQGIEPLRRARQAAKVPLVAIGGINAENVAPVVEAGADAICVTAAVGAAPDPEAAASRLVKAIRAAGGRV
ncbi:MAG: thiamine phosphate synthase [Chloroflexota bacterium]